MPSQRWAVVLAVAGALLVAGFAAFAILTAAPPSAANLASSVADGVEATELTTTDASAAVIVPEGWVVVREGDAEIVVLTPDAAMTVRIALTSGTAADVVGRAGGVGTLRRETLASELDVVHVDLDGGRIIASVAVPAGVVGLRSELLREVHPDAYRPAFAELLEGIRP